MPGVVHASLSFLLAAVAMAPAQGVPTQGFPAPASDPVGVVLDEQLAPVEGATVSLC